MIPKVRIVRETYHEADEIDSTTTPDTNRRLGGGSRIANRDERIESQQLPAPDASPTSTPTPGHEGGNPGEHSQL